MKKLLLSVSCLAVVLILSNVSVAQEAAEGDCPKPAPQLVTIPFNYPGMSFGMNPRDVRRAVRFDARTNARNARIEARFAQPDLPYASASTVVDSPEGGAAHAAAVSPAPVGMSQMGPARNVSMRSGPGAVGNVINFLSVTRVPREYYRAPQK